MKRIFCVLSLLFLTEGLFSQVYKRESVFSGGGDMTYLSYWRPLDKAASVGGSIFELRGNKAYTNDSTVVAYDVDYYKADAAKMFYFLSRVANFADRYAGEDDVITFIDGVKVRTEKLLVFRYTCVYDSEGKVHCSFTAGQWRRMLGAFESYCKKHGIIFQNK